MLLENDCFDISSTEARRLLRFKIAAPYSREAVLREIEAEGLYGVGENDKGLSFERLKDVSLALHKSSRVPHAIGVCETAREMAKKYGADETLAARAGILHDVTKALNAKAALLLAEKWNVDLTVLSARTRSYCTQNRRGSRAGNFRRVRGGSKRHRVAHNGKAQYDEA